MGFRRSFSSLVAQWQLCILTARRLPHFLLAFAILNLLLSTHLHAEDTPQTNSVGKPVVYRQGSFVLHTDLPQDVAEERLSGLTRLKERLDRYWNSQLKGTIECYVVVGLDAWPAESIPKEAFDKLKIRSAITLTDRLKEDDRVLSIKSNVYATDHVENLHHEVVHAYCWQTFERCGPAWYAEGMAEVFGWSHHQTNGVHYFDWAIKYLHENAQSPTVAEVVAKTDNKRPLWQTYAQRWALCYLLMHDARYSERFRKFGQQLLRGEDVEFSKSFADIQEPLANDYRQFLKDVRSGFEFPKRKGEK